MKQYIMLSLPNTGTDWFAKCIVENNPDLNYFREFFNPMTNEKYSHILSKAFGCEYASTVNYITAPNLPHTETYKQTWCHENYNFTKENYSAFKVDFFAEHFNCFVLFRSIKQSLPCANLDRYNQFKSWYDAMFYSLVLNENSLDQDIQEMISFAKYHSEYPFVRFVSAYVIYYHKLLNDALKKNIRILEYSKLINLNGGNLTEYLNNVPGIINPLLTSQYIESTRNIGRENKFNELGLKINEFYNNLISLTSDYYKELEEKNYSTETNYGKILQ